MIKIRLPNSGLKLGSSNGFRLFFIIDRGKPQIIFLYIYPKQGKYGITNISDKDQNRLLQTFVSESNDNLLKEFKMS